MDQPIKKLYKKKIKDLTKNLLLAISVIIIFLILLEIFFCVFDIGYQYVESESRFIKHSTYNPFLIFGPNIDINNEQNNEIAHWNSEGFRLDYELYPERQNVEYLIIALGGSTTENLGNGENLHYPTEASTLLNNDEKIEPEILIVNSGKSAYSSAHSLIRLQFDIIRFKPDMISIMHNINDLTVNFFPSSGNETNYGNKFFNENYAPSYNIKNNQIIRKSRVLLFFYDSIGNIKNRIFGVESSNGKIMNTMRFSKEEIKLEYKETFRSNLISMCEIAKANNITVVLMSQPAVFSEEKISLAFGHKEYNNYILYPSKEEFQKYFEEYNLVIEEVAESEEVYYIDMYNLMGHDDEYFLDMVHYSPEGIVRFSEIYSEELKKILED